MPAINTAKFGKVECRDGDIITFVRAILGFEDMRRFILISRPESEPFKWLQSSEDPNVSFVVIEPAVVVDDYVVEISPHDIRQLEGSQQLSDYKIYVIVTVPQGQPENMSINLQGPLVINAKNLKAIQMVLNNSDYDIKFNLFHENSQVAQ